MKKNKFIDHDEMYKEKELEDLYEWIINNLRPAREIHLTKPEDQKIMDFSRKTMDTLISEVDIEVFASLDLGRSQGFDYVLIRFMMREIDPSPLKIENDDTLYYRATWKTIEDPGRSDKWRIQP